MKPEGVARFAAGRQRRGPWDRHGSAGQHTEHTAAAPDAHHAELYCRRTDLDKGGKTGVAAPRRRPGAVAPLQIPTLGGHQALKVGARRGCAPERSHANRAGGGAAARGTRVQAPHSDDVGGSGCLLVKVEGIAGQHAALQDIALGLSIRCQLAPDVARKRPQGGKVKHGGGRQLDAEASSERIAQLHCTERVQASLQGGRGEAGSARFKPISPWRQAQDEAGTACDAPCAPSSPKLPRTSMSGCSLPGTAPSTSAAAAATASATTDAGSACTAALPRPCCHWLGPASSCKAWLLLPAAPIRQVSSWSEPASLTTAAAALRGEGRRPTMSLATAAGVGWSKARVAGRSRPKEAASELRSSTDPRESRPACRGWGNGNSRANHRG